MPEIGTLLHDGTALFDSGRFDKADALFRQILDFDPAHKEATLRRIAIARRSGRKEHVLSLIDAAIRSDPSNAEWPVGRALALSELDRNDEAFEAFDHAIALREDFGDAWFGKAQLLLALRRYKEGWELFEWRFYMTGWPAADRPFRQPLWDGAGFHGRMLLVHAEQGLGDTIQFYRFVTMARSFGGVIVEAQEALVRLLASQPHAPMVIARGRPLPRFDLQCPMMTLPLLLGTELHSIPAAAYLTADPGLSAAWGDRLPAADGRRRIGIVWAGSVGHQNDHNHSMKLSEMLAMLDPEAVVVSLQKEVRAADREVLRKASHVVDLGAGLTDFADTAAVISQLDLVISVDTSVAHLAGALGKPIWVLLPAMPDWRWMLGREDSPWYPSARLFRQTSAGDWSSVATRVREALRR